MADSDSDNHIFFSSPVFVTLIPLSNKATIGLGGHNSVKSGVRRHSSVNFLAFSYPHHPTWSWLLVPSLSCILTIIQHWASRPFLPTSMSNCDLNAPSNGVLFTNETVYELWNARVWLAETALEDNSLNFWTRFLRKWTRQRAVLTDRSTLRRSMIYVLNVETENTTSVARWSVLGIEKYYVYYQKNASYRVFSPKLILVMDLS